MGKRGRKTNEQIVKEYFESATPEQLLEIMQKRGVFPPSVRAEVAESEEDFEVNYGRLQKLYNLAKGRTDVKHKIDLILDPENIKTTSYLTSSQVDFAFLCYFCAEEFKSDGFEPMENFADIFLLTKLSEQGRGPELAVRLMSAISESRLLKTLGIVTGREEKVRTSAKKLRD